MEYRRFVELKQRDCADFEHRLEAARGDPRAVSYDDLEQIAFRYRRLLHDHALAAARFPGTAMTRRLRHLVLAGTHWLQRDTGDHLPTLGQFVTRTFPRAMGRLWPLVGVAAALFAAAAVFGFGLTVAEPALGLAFLGPEAVSGLKEGRLWTESIFAVTPGSVASSQIATNNMSVALTGWAGGAVAGIGGLYVILLNGLMLGSVIATTAHYSMTAPLMSFIAAHGPLEISLILVTAAAGLGVGKAMVIASDRPRAELIQAAGRDALVVLLGCLPWIFLLGFVEGFLSPSSELSTTAKLTFGTLLESLFLAFAWNPWRSDAARRA